MGNARRQPQPATLVRIGLVANDPRSWQDITADDGSFAIRGLPAGRYRVQAARYTEETQIDEGAARSLDIVIDG